MLLGDGRRKVGLDENGVTLFIDGVKKEFWRWGAGEKTAVEALDRVADVEEQAAINAQQLLTVELSQSGEWELPPVTAEGSGLQFRYTLPDVIPDGYVFTGTCTVDCKNGNQSVEVIICRTATAGGRTIFMLRLRGTGETPKRVTKINCRFLLCKSMLEYPLIEV